ncbi:MAG: hypothetical protein U0M42_06985 [Acutalibacteraceae bacterium]|nr:hypothetical protein [Acutalibacteraceae bacterium]
MLEIFTVAFFGHRYIDNPFKVEELLEEHIRKLIDEKEYVDFLVGRNGEFDQYVSSTVLRVRKNIRDDNSSLVLMLPYPTAEYINNQNYFEDYYNDIEISYAASKTHPKSAIQIRNREMVDRADLIICYIKHNEGGAYKTVKYASKQNKPIINLVDCIDD